MTRFWLPAAIVAGCVVVGAVAGLGFMAAVLVTEHVIETREADE